MTESRHTFWTFLNKLVSEPEAAWRDAEILSKRIATWLVEVGKLSAEDARDLVAELAEKSRTSRQDLEERLDKFVSEKLRVTSIPRREDLTDLRQRINQLIDRVDRLENRWQKRKKK